MGRISTLVVAADGGTARFFTWPKPDDYLAEHDDLRMDVPPSKGERGPAPRVQDSTGHHRHRIERRLTAHEANEEKFLADVASRIESRMKRLSATSLILCAPPKALGSLRAALTKAGQDYELATIAKDLTKETVRQLDRRIRNLRAFQRASG
jgi:protein required for attachment to host cells